MVQVNPPEPFVFISAFGLTVIPEVATLLVPMFEVAPTVPPLALDPENVICI